ncbi:MAG: PIN domain nuclease [Thermodesulfobacteriota bacterium]|nr:PIN domain nuclease [Thermodesulfobacteriota bacterium]
MPPDRFLVDTSLWILALRKGFVSDVKDRIDHLLREDTIVTTGIIMVEILSGAKTEKEFRRLKKGLDALDRVETDRSVWEEASELGFTLRRKGVTVPHTDILIATCALRASAVVVHADAHFDLIAKHYPLKVESYVQTLQKAHT